jgi:hypothetical protein
MFPTVITRTDRSSLRSENVDFAVGRAIWNRFGIQTFAAKEDGQEGVRLSWQAMTHTAKLLMEPNGTMPKPLRRLNRNQTHS